ncbi:MAG: acyltransferase family protein [Rhodospirillales bacterium]
MNPIANTDRRSDIDWLRVLAFSLLILYHAGMPYVDWDWHIKNTEHWPALQEVMRFVNRWRMSLIFLIAGGTIMLSLGRRSGPAFVCDRIKRILLPLVFGMLVIVPPQVYLERVQKGRFAGSFFDFYPHFFEGTYPAGNFSWHHLWFLAYVLVLTLALLPLFLWMRSEKGAAALDGCSAFVARHYLVALLAVPLFAVEFWLVSASSNRNGLVGDWSGLASNGVLMLAGALLYRSPLLLQSRERQRFVALAVGIVAYAALEVGFFSGPAIKPQTSVAWLGFCALSAINLTAWLIAITGFARRLAPPTAFLRYATPAVYPFYILHQTVAVIYAFYLVQTDWAVPIKYAATALLTFAGTWFMYEFAVRRLAILRPLFGMSPRSSGQRQPNIAAMPAWHTRLRDDVA